MNREADVPIAAYQAVRWLVDLGAPLARRLPGDANGGCCEPVDNVLAGATTLLVKGDVRR